MATVECRNNQLSVYNLSLSDATPSPLCDPDSGVLRAHPDGMGVVATVRTKRGSRSLEHEEASLASPKSRSAEPARNKRDVQDLFVGQQLLPKAFSQPTLQHSLEHMALALGNPASQI